MEIIVLILIVAFCAWLDCVEEEEASADPVALALPTLQGLEREAQQALAELRALDDDGRQS